MSNIRKDICRRCGGPAPASERCTNGHCAKCHREACTAGGATSPGHNVKAGWLTFTLEQFHEMDGEQSGACVICGAVRDCCEPDARNYSCYECGRAMVFGAQELLIMGLVH